MASNPHKLNRREHRLRHHGLEPHIAALADRGHIIVQRTETQSPVALRLGDSGHLELVRGSRSKHVIASFTDAEAKRLVKATQRLLDLQPPEPPDTPG